MNPIVFIVIGLLVVVIIILGRAVCHNKNRTEEEIDKVQKYLEFYDVLIRWVKLKQEQKTLTEYFVQNEYETAAIYGMKEIGRLLLKELRQEGIKVKYAIDKNADEISADVTVLRPSSNMPEVDVIIVTASHYFDKIYLEIKGFTKADIVPIEDIFWALCENLE